MTTIKTAEEMDRMRAGGSILSGILAELVNMARPGVTTGEIDAHAERRMKEEGGEPSFKGYKTALDPRPFPSTVCTSINDEVVHAPADPSRELKDGELFKMDIGFWYKDLCTDMAVTVLVGTVKEDAVRLTRATKEALLIGVEKAVPGGWISDIGKAVDSHVRRQGFSTVKDLVGHGVGHAVHEDPRIPNYLDPTLDPVRIEPGMMLAIEPMVNMGGDAIRVLEDGWTVATADGSLSAHFEVTVAVLDSGNEILTPLPENT